MRRTLILQTLVITSFLPLSGFPAPTPAAAETASDPRAVAVADRVMEAMGGRDAYEAARLLRFDFQVSRGDESYPPRRHWWDRHTGAYRLEGSTPEGEPYRVLFDVHTRQGDAWVGTRPIEGDELASMLERAHARFINDTYWLLMPWKWLDPGVHLAWEGERTTDGVTHDVVRLTFDAGTGLTSGDRYWGFVNRETGLMERWEYVLQQEDGSPGEGPPRAFLWTGWEPSEAGILLSTSKPGLGEGPRIEIAFPVAEARSDVAEEELRAIFREGPPTRSDPGTP